MSLNQSSIRLDDSPKSRVQRIVGTASCEAFRYNGKIDGYCVTAGPVIAYARSSYTAWQLAEAKLADLRK